MKQYRWPYLILWPVLVFLGTSPRSLVFPLPYIVPFDPVSPHDTFSTLPPDPRFLVSAETFDLLFVYGGSWRSFLRRDGSRTKVLNTGGLSVLLFIHNEIR